MIDRFKCPTCGGYYTLRANGTIRYHTRPAAVAPHRPEPCPGVGQQPGPSLLDGRPA